MSTNQTTFYNSQYRPLTTNQDTILEGTSIEKYSAISYE